MSADDVQWYFAYGSNLLAAQMIERTGPIRTGDERPRRARLSNYQVVFNMLGDDGETYANIEPAKGDVLGVIYCIGSSGLQSLDEFEEGYERQTVSVVSEDGSELEAIAYLSLPKNVTEPRQPSEEYFEKIIRGALEHGLPEEYVRTLRISARIDYES